MRTSSFRAALIASAALASTPVLAQSGAPNASQAGVDAADAAVSELVVTGLRGQARSIVDSPAPIDVVSAEQLSDTGKQGLKEVLNTLLPSFNLPGVNGGGTSWTVRSVTLRGLNGDQALFLVNGKRRHTTSLINNLARVGRGGVPVDLDLIPAASIARIEVLRDGAAAQYGSDAIAGVINIILKSDDEGGQFGVNTGRNYLGDGETIGASATYARPLGQDGFVDFGINWKNSRAASRAIQSTARYIYPALPGGAADPRDATIPRNFWGQSYGPGEEDVIATSVNAELPISDQTQLYAFGTLSHRSSKKNTGSYLPNNTTRPNTTTALPEVYPEGFNALRRIFQLDTQVAFGARGERGDWRWDLSTTVAHDNAQLDGQNTLNATLGPASPTYFHLSTHVFDQATTNFDVAREYELGLAGPLTLALGAEHRFEQFEIHPGDEASYVIGDYVIPAGQPFAGRPPAPGLSSYAGTTPDDAGKISRNSYAAYVDVGGDVLENWYVGAAARAEYYSGGVGSTVSGKLSTRWEFAPGYAVRATVSNGFRAPSLAQTIFGSSTFSSIQCPPPAGVVANCQPGVPFVSAPTKVLPTFSPAAISLGAEPLEPETSVNYSFGITAEPLPRLRLTVDAYQIEIDDRIVDTSVIRGPVVGAILAANGLQSDLSVSYYTNAVNTRTRGVDAVVEYAFDLAAYGDLRLSAAYAWNKTEITKIKPTPAVLANLGYALFDRQKQADLTVGTPRDKLSLSEIWSLDRWKVSLRQTRYGEYTEAGSQPVNDRTYSPKWVVDLDVSFDLDANTTLGIGANNLFDQYPDEIGLLSPDTGTGRFGSFSPFGITGGYYYARFERRF